MTMGCKASIIATEPLTSNLLFINFIMTPVLKFVENLVGRLAQLVDLPAMLRQPDSLTAVMAAGIAMQAGHCIHIYNFSGT